MTMRLNDSQRAFLRSEPIPEGQPNKLRLALRLADANQTGLHDATGIANAQLSRYLNGRDLMLSTADRIARVFGLTVSDLWPNPPAAKADRRRRKTIHANGRAVKTKAAKRAPKAQVAA